MTTWCAFPRIGCLACSRLLRESPHAGYLAANVVQDERTNGAKPAADKYRAVDYAGTVLEEGPTGGWCTMTSLEVLSRVGNFIQRRGRVFFDEDGDFARRCQRAGYTIGIVQEVVVYHATGLSLNDVYGYLDVYQQKYASAPEYSDFLAAAAKRAEGRGA